MARFKDLTLREGSQVPGIEISDDAGIAILDNLASLDVEFAELSFPRANARSSWYRHADRLGMRTAALARATSADVDAALEVQPDEVSVMVNTSDVQLEYALGKRPEEARAMLVENVKRVTEAGVDAGAVLMDAFRADVPYLESCTRAVTAAGAVHVTLADTTGSSTPVTVSERVNSIVSATPDHVDVGIHTHDDLGVATANAFHGAIEGASTIDVTVGGIGERAGNAPLEAIAVLLSEHGTDIDVSLDDLVPVCRTIHDILNVEIPPGQPVLGARAYRHESGLHTAAMLTEPGTFEAFSPSTYGGQRQLLFGIGTGKGAIRALLDDEGVEPTSAHVFRTKTAIDVVAEQTGDLLSEGDVRSLIRDYISSGSE